MKKSVEILKIVFTNYNLEFCLNSDDLKNWKVLTEEFDILIKDFESLCLLKKRSLSTSYCTLILCLELRIFSLLLLPSSYHSSLSFVSFSSRIKGSKLCKQTLTAIRLKTVNILSLLILDISAKWFGIPEKIRLEVSVLTVCVFVQLSLVEYWFERRWQMNGRHPMWQRADNVATSERPENQLCDDRKFCRGVESSCINKSWYRSDRFAARLRRGVNKLRFVVLVSD